MPKLTIEEWNELISTIKSDEIQLSTLNLCGLNLDNNQVGELAIALRTNTSLKELDLSQNTIDDATALTLLGTLQCNLAITKLNLDANFLSNDFLTRLNSEFSDVKARVSYAHNFGLCEYPAEQLWLARSPSILKYFRKLSPEESATHVKLKINDLIQFDYFKKNLAKDEYIRYLEIELEKISFLTMSTLSDILENHPTLITVVIFYHKPDDLYSGMNEETMLASFSEIMKKRPQLLICPLRGGSNIHRTSLQSENLNTSLKMNIEKLTSNLLCADLMSEDAILNDTTQINNRKIKHLTRYKLINSDPLVVVRDLSSAYINLLTFHLAIQHEDIPLVKKLFKQSFLIAKNDKGDTALHTAVEMKNIELIKYFLEKAKEYNLVYKVVTVTNKTSKKPIELTKEPFIQDLIKQATNSQRSQDILSNTTVAFFPTSSSAKSRFATQELSLTKIDIEQKKIIGKGAYGCVYKTKWGKATIAIKQFDKSNNQLIISYNNEYKILKKLNHCDFIVKLLGALETTDYLYLAMELAALGSLHSVLFKENEDIKSSNQWLFLLPWTNVVGDKYYFLTLHQILLGIIEGLCVLQENGITHRDIKSENILITANGGVKITDFGVSEFLKNFTNEKIGTKNLIDPQVLTGDISEEQLDKIDIYAFAIVLWQMATREKYIPNFSEEEIINKNKRPSIPDNCPQIIKLLIQNCWHQNPKLRLSAHELQKFVNDSSFKSTLVRDSLDTQSIVLNKR